VQVAFLFRYFVGLHPFALRSYLARPRKVWCDADGREVIEEYIIEAMGHGTPISAEGDEGLGEEGKYMLEVGISSTRHIADFWGVTQSGAANRAELKTAA